MRLAEYAVIWLRGQIRGERGQDLIEYSLLGGFIALSLVLAISVSLPVLTGSLNSMFEGIGNCIDWESSSCSPF
jgi:Flp pilus assembly pilin Flp